MDALKYHLGQKVYFPLDPDASGVITGILFRPGGAGYQVTWEDKAERFHYEFELAAERVILVSGST